MKGISYPAPYVQDVVLLCSIKILLPKILKPFTFWQEKPGKSKVSASLGRVFYWNLECRYVSEVGTGLCEKVQ